MSARFNRLNSLFLSSGFCPLSLDDIHLTNEWSDIYETAQKAESYVFTEPTVSAFLSRKALEEMLSWLYDHDSSLELPDKEPFSLNDLIRERSFQATWGRV